ncbi:hypothetical protein H6G80_01165 [Nostoc sp. FACHB-87]|uniref:hypothetical protein n=1 Tax=Nostocaceae TaxID=1162 RepID=UPI0016855D66|nr:MULTISPECIES: hypothetical protein [Nostocaceae]MBD2452711.1 hypothetical protein [Nostoc sp. FACHB-87]MBD2473642.1 hypothetical protein [Anabaena sp. FACHB-83]
MEPQNVEQLQTEESLNNSDLDVVTENDVVSEISGFELDSSTNTNEFGINGDASEQEATENTLELPGKKLKEGCLVNGKWVAC